MAMHVFDSRSSHHYWTPDHPSVLLVARETQTSPNEVSVFFGSLPVLSKEGSPKKDVRYWLYMASSGRSHLTLFFLVEDGLEENLEKKGVVRVRFRKFRRYLHGVILQIVQGGGYAHLSLEELPDFRRLQRQKIPRHGWKPPPPFSRHPHQVCVR